MLSTRLKNFLIYWLPLIVYGLLIYIQSDHPSPDGLPSFEFSDKLLHFAAYAVMGVLFLRAYRSLAAMNDMRLAALLSMISAALYGISDEIHQAFIPFRDAQISDVIADILGAVAGVYVYHRWLTSGRARRQNAAGKEHGGAGQHTLGQKRVHKPR
jgi:VanZ family protein